MSKKSFLIVLFSALILFSIYRASTILSQKQSSSHSSKYIVCISQIVEHPALDNTRKGIIDGLMSEGFVDGKNLDLCYENAQGNIALSSQIAQKMISKNPHVVVAISTPSAQTALKETASRNIPLVFATVTDPLSAGIISSKRKEMVTGTSNMTPFVKQLDLMKSLLPQIKKLGVIYNPGEINSVNLVALMKAQGKLNHVEIVAVTANKTSEVPSAAKSLVGAVDAIFINNDNTALSAFEGVVRVALEQNIPVFSSDIDSIAQGALAVIGPNQYQLGLQTSKLITKILKGTSANTLDFELPNSFELHINQDVATKMNIAIPETLKAKAVFFKKS